MQIMYNGNASPGRDQATVADLLKLMSREPLDPTFEDYGNFLCEDDGEWQAWGNFWNYSHCFDIRGTREELHDLEDAIRANQRTPAYVQAQTEWHKRTLRQTIEHHRNHIVHLKNVSRRDETDEDCASTTFHLRQAEAGLIAATNKLSALEAQ